jgi:erythromycin esterase
MTLAKRKMTGTMLGAVVLVGVQLSLTESARADEPKQANGLKLGLPRGWAGGSPNRRAYASGIDREVVHGGQASGFVRMTGARPHEFGTLVQSVRAEPYRGRRIRLAGFLKTEGANDGAGLWMRVDGTDAILTFDNMDSRRICWTRDWQEVDVVLDVAQKARTITFGLILVGDGKAWVDDLRIEVVGKDVPSTNLFDQERQGEVRLAIGASPPANLNFEEGIGAPGLAAMPVDTAPLTVKQAQWLRARVIPFDTAEAGRGFTDLQPLKTAIGAARIVALGEGTHGTREFFQMKHRLTEFLAAEMGFTLFVIEANMPEAQRVNEYVLTGKGNPRELLRGLYFWTWDTQEVLDLILWMRRFNELGNGRVQFLGIDMQFGELAMSNTRAFVADFDPNYTEDLEAVYQKLDDYWGSVDLVRGARELPDEEKAARARGAWRVVEHLEASRASYQKKVESDRVERAIQDARIAAQAAELMVRGGGYRDQCMAENVAWILDHSPRGSKIVLWAHSGHVARQPGWMGAHLADRYGSELFVAGFASHTGRYTAIQPGLGLVASNNLSPSEPGSLEWRLHETGLPRLVLDLRQASKDAPESSWLRRPHDFRAIGAVAIDRQFFPIVVPDAYDAIIYFDQTHASACFRARGATGR